MRRCNSIFLRSYMFLLIVGCSNSTEDPQLPAQATIGEFREGGIVFWVDPSDNTHGLVCAVSDQSSGIQWYNGEYTKTGATGEYLGMGSSNTDSIIAKQGAVETDYAAGQARAYRGGGYTDWFLPSHEELYEMWANKATIDAIALANNGSAFELEGYWSSMEGNDKFAQYRDMKTASPNARDKSLLFRVRAVRTF